MPFCRQKRECSTGASRTVSRTVSRTSLERSLEKSLAQYFVLVCIYTIRSSLSQSTLAPGVTLTNIQLFLVEPSRKINSRIPLRVPVTGTETIGLRQTPPSRVTRGFNATILTNALRSLDHGHVTTLKQQVQLFLPFTCHTRSYCYSCPTAAASPPPQRHHTILLIIYSRSGRFRTLQRRQNFVLYVVPGPMPISARRGGNAGRWHRWPC